MKILLILLSTMTFAQTPSKTGIVKSSPIKVQGKSIDKSDSYSLMTLSKDQLHTFKMNVKLSKSLSSANLAVLIEDNKTSKTYMKILTKITKPVKELSYPLYKASFEENSKGYKILIVDVDQSSVSQLSKIKSCDEPCPVDISSLKMKVVSYKEVMKAQLPK